MRNVTIVFTDGNIQTHKIIVASASDFIKHPVSDQITFYLPEHTRHTVVETLSVISNSKNLFGISIEVPEKMKVNLFQVSFVTNYNSFNR